MSIAGAATPHIAFCVSDLDPGSVQHALVRIAAGIAQTGCRVSLVVCRGGGKLEAALPRTIERVMIRSTSKTRARVAALRADPDA